MSKECDLQMVFAGISTAGLRDCLRALRHQQVISGRFVDADGRGCLFYHLSQRQMVDRASRIEWTRRNPFFTAEHDRAIRRLIVGWDAVAPTDIVKGPGYEQEYPQATYVVRTADVRRAILEILAERRGANRLEEAAIRRAQSRAEAKV